MVPYFVALLLVGIPLMWIEWTIGRFGGGFGHSTAPGMFHSLWEKNRFIKYFGVIGIFGPIVIFVYYTYIESWLLGYSVFALLGTYDGCTDHAAMSGFLNAYRGLERNAHFSGIGTAYYKVGSPPNSASDGSRVDAPQGRITGIQVPREGKHALYVWLADNAGNKDYRRYASVPEALWYDVTPPTTTLTFNGTPGIGGWYRSTGTVNLATQDAVSGPASTYYRINGGAWQTGTAFPLSLDGSYTLEYYSVDQAGNREATRSSTVKIDTVGPVSRVITPTEYYQDSEIVAVAWSGSDSGSGVLYYDVEYKDGASGAWTAWRTATDETSGNFVGERGHVYYMRSRARDRAGNVETMASDAYGDIKFYIERIGNGAGSLLMRCSQTGVIDCACAADHEATPSATAKTG